VVQEAQLFIGCAVRVTLLERVDVVVPERVDIDVAVREGKDDEGEDVEVFTAVVVERAQVETTNNKINKGGGMGAGESTGQATPLPPLPKE
jgi:hypothetical protein